MNSEEGKQRAAVAQRRQLTGTGRRGVAQYRYSCGLRCWYLTQVFSLSEDFCPANKKETCFFFLVFKDTINVKCNRNFRAVVVSSSGAAV